MMNIEPSETPADGQIRRKRTSRPPRRVVLGLSWYSHGIHRGVAKYARDAEWILDPTLTHSVSRGLGRLPETRADGYLCVLGESKLLDRLIADAGKPTVDMAFQADHVNVPRVLPDGHAQGRIVADHLLSRAFKNYAFFIRKQDHIALERLAGVEHALDEAHAKLNLLNWHARSRRKKASGRIPWLAQQLKTLPMPLALIAESDDAAIEALEACELADLLVPEQVALVGYDNDELVCDFARVPLTSLDCNLEGLGYEAAKLLDRLMDGEPAPPDPILVQPGRLFPRQSSDILAINHVQVAQAYRFILANYTNPQITVPDIALAAGLSRSGLNRAFAHHLGRSVSSVLHEIRVENAKRMLAGSNLAAGQIAEECGFSSLKHLRRSLLKAIGMGPRQYRSLNCPT